MTGGALRMTFTIVILRAKPEGSLPGFPEMMPV
jgi:hypothetical protein